MEIFESTIDDIQITALIDDPWKPCLLRIEYTKFDVVLDHTFLNAVGVSAFLEAELGLGRAVQFLDEHGIPKTHPLWHLNHSDLWVRA